MSGNGNDPVVDLNRKFGIADLMKRAAAEREKGAVPSPAEEAASGPDALPSMDKLTPLPSPGDPYKAYARPANQMVPTLHLLTGDGQTWSFPNSGRVEGPHRLIVEDDPGKGAVLVLRFAASVAIEVMIAGTNLDDLHINLGENRIRWVREFPPNRMLRDDGAPVVRTLTVRTVSPKLKGWPISPQGGEPARPGNGKPQRAGGA